MASGTIKKQFEPKVLSTIITASIVHADFTNFASNKPTDTSYYWFLIGFLPGVATIKLCGIDAVSSRVLCSNDTGAAVSTTCTLSWLGIKK